MDFLVAIFIMDKTYALCEVVVLLSKKTSCVHKRIYKLQSEWSLPNRLLIWTIPCNHIYLSQTSIRLNKLRVALWNMYLLHKRKTINILNMMIMIVILDLVFAFYTKTFFATRNTVSKAFTVFFPALRFLASASVAKIWFCALFLLIIERDCLNLLRFLLWLCVRKLLDFAVLPRELLSERLHCFRYCWSSSCSYSLHYRIFPTRNKHNTSTNTNSCYTYSNYHTP